MTHMHLLKILRGISKNYLKNTLCIGLLFNYSFSWSADYFDPIFLGEEGKNGRVDLSSFTEEGGIATGEYIVSVFVNQQMSGQFTVLFVKNDQGLTVPVLTPKMLAQLGVNVSDIDSLKKLSPTTEITNLSYYIPDASTRFLLSGLRLDISIPQVAMISKIPGQVDPVLLDDGIISFLSNYNLSAGQTKSTYKQGESIRESNLFATLNSGINLGAWRLRSTFTQTYSKLSHGITESISRFDNTYLYRGINALRSEFVIGESYTGSDIFDSVPFRGIQLKSSEEMLPDQLQGYSPIISGVASSNARVTVRQNGNIVYETYVAPGAFSFSDLPQNGMSGDYNVTVTEADGTIKKFIVPYSSLPIMLRPGSWKYEVTAGEYHSNTSNDNQKNKFILGSLAHGFSNNHTLYGGIIASKDYQSINLGSGLSLGIFGALSADISASIAQFKDNIKRTGQSYRLRYSKSLLSTGTTLDLTALRYSTQDYYSFNEFNNQEGLAAEFSPWSQNKRRSSFQISLSQNFDQWGMIYFRANRDDYWGSNKTLTGVSVNYSNSFRKINYSVNYNIDRIQDGNNNWPENRQLSLNVNIPFNIFDNKYMNMMPAYATTSISHNNHGQTQNSLGISGNVYDNKLSYSLSQNWGNQGQVSNSNLNVGYDSSKANLNAGYSYSSRVQTLNMNINGGVVVHNHGVTLSKTLGDSIALINAPGAKGASLINGNETIDGNGYAVSPYLTSYRRNNIGIEPTTLPNDVDILQSNINVYPTKGAVINAKFSTRIGHQALITLINNNSSVPFGAIATLIGTDETYTVSSIVGDRGEVYLTGLPDKGTLSVKWGNQEKENCTATFDLTKTTALDNGLFQVSTTCQAY